MVQVGLCTLLITLHRLDIFTVIPKNKRRVEQIFILILKNYFVSKLTRPFKLTDNPTGYLF